MLIGLILRLCERPSGVRALAVVVSAAVAWFTVTATNPQVPAGSVAGVAQVGLMQDEHALIADYLSRTAAADRAAGLAETRERNAMRPLTTVNAPGVPLPRPAKPVRLAEAAKTKAALDASPTVVDGPLPLQSANSPPRPASAPKGARAVLATVERVPRWAWAAVQNAADWAIIGPVQTIARLPERRFL